MKDNLERYNLEEILAGYVLGNLTEEEMIWLNHQLQINPELQQQVQQLEDSLNLMPLGLPEDIMPPVSLREKILHQGELITKLESSLSKDKPLFSVGKIMTAIVTLAVISLGINNYNLRQQLANNNQQLQHQQELIALMRQSDNLLVSLNGSSQLPQASGNLLVSRTAQQAFLTVQNLRPLSGSQVYRLWAVTADKKIGCINFTPDRNGQVDVKFSDNSLKQAQAILITIEPKIDTEKPQGETILVGYY